MYGTLIPTYPQLNIVGSRITKVPVKPWEARGCTASEFSGSTTFTIPEWIRCVEDTTPEVIVITRLTEIMITNK